MKILKRKILHSDLRKKEDVSIFGGQLALFPFITYNNLLDYTSQRRSIQVDSIYI
jgi:hypothetical protein